MSKNIIDLQQVIVDRGTRKGILKIESFTLGYGELAAVVGPNGAGKSTLLQVINLLQEFHGNIRLFGQDVRQANKIELRRRSAMVFQELLLLKDSVYNNVAWPLRFRGLKSKQIKEKVYKALSDFKCDHLTDRSARLLSGGEAQRVCLARALVTDPELLLLDEPFASLDTAAKSEMLEELRQVARARAITVLFVSHNLTEILRFADRVIVLLGGSIVQNTAPEIILRKPINEQVARIAGMDNIIPCTIDKSMHKTIVSMAGGMQFAHPGKLDKSSTACCLPGDVFQLYDNSFGAHKKQWLVFEGKIERVIPGVGDYLITVRCNKQLLNVRLLRSQITDNIISNMKIKLLFNPKEAHFI